MRPGTTTSIAAFSLAVLLVAPGAHAQDEGSFLDAYKAGVEAVEAENWPQAERLMRTAIAGRSEEAERLIRYLHLRPYIPHFYLGLALAEQGRCEEALEELAESERQGVVTGLGDEMTVLRAQEASCRERMAEQAASRDRRQAVVGLVAQAEASASSVAALADDPALAAGWESGDPSLADRLEEARATIARARQRLAGDEGSGDDALLAAGDLARGALGQLEAIRKESELRRDAATQERDRLAVRISALAGPGRDLLESTRELARTAPELARRRDALVLAVERAANVATDGPIADLQAMARSLERRIAELRTAAAPPPEALMSAAEAWLRGDPEAVLAALPAGDASDAVLAFDDPRARAQALLLRSAAAFTLHETSGKPDSLLLDVARRDAAECRHLDPELSPLASAFSPRFRAFFASVEPAAPPQPAP